MNTILRRPLVPVLVFLCFYAISVLAYIHFSHLNPDDYSLKSLQIVQLWQSPSSFHHRLVPHYLIGDHVIPYLSHPPFAFYFLYAFNHIFGFSSFYVLNALLVVVSAFFVYLTICILTLKHAQSDVSLYAWLGMILYLFAFPILRFQFFNFHPDIFVLPFLIIAQYLFLKLLMKERYRSIKYSLLIAIFLAIMSYASWFGVVFNLIIIILAIINLRKGYKLVPYILIASLITLASIMVIYGQYAIFGGWKNVIYYFKDTYLRESPFYGHIRQSSFQILVQTMKNLGVYILWLVSLLLYSIFTKKRKFLFTKNGYRYLFLSVFPVLLYSLLLIHYFQNTFTSLYFVPPLVISIIILLEKIFKSFENKFQLLKIVGLIILSNLSLFLLN